MYNQWTFFKIIIVVNIDNMQTGMFFTQIMHFFVRLSQSIPWYNEANIPHKMLNLCKEPSC